MLELITLGVSIVVFLAGVVVGDLLKQRRCRLRREAVAWAEWAHRQQQLAAAYDARINGRAS